MHTPLQEKPWGWRVMEKMRFPNLLSAIAEGLCKRETRRKPLRVKASPNLFGNIDIHTVAATCRVDGDTREVEVQGIALCAQIRSRRPNA